MHIRTKLFVILVISTSIVATSGFGIIYALQRVAEPLNGSIPRNIEALSHVTYLDNLAQSIRYYDEVLTQSARNYAFTEDRQWEERYRSAEPELDRTIKEAIAAGDDTERAFFSTVDNANLALVDLEYRAIELVNEGRAEEAVQILESEEYWGNKAIYKQGLDAYVAAREEAYAQESLLAQQTLALANAQEQQTRELLDRTTQLLAIAIPAMIVIMVLVGVQLLHNIVNPIRNLVKATNELAKGNYHTNLGDIRNDETGILASTFDKMRKELEEKERAKDEFLCIAAHELRTPLQPILFCADSALAGDMERDKALAVILNQAKRLRQLSSDILDVTRLESGTLKYNMGKTRINDMIQAIISAAKTGLNGDIAIESNLRSSDNLDLVVDAGRLTQVLANIVGNAIKFTQQGVIKVSTDADRASDELRITVTDSGKGISGDIMPKLFSKFATTSNKEGSGQGTGLGLYLAAKIMEGHKGRIWAHNNERGKGATFGIALPLNTNGKEADKAQDSGASCDGAKSQFQVAGMN